MRGKAFQQRFALAKIIVAGLYTTADDLIVHDLGVPLDVRGEPIICHLMANLSRTRVRRKLLLVSTEVPNSKFFALQHPKSV